MLSICDNDDELAVVLGHEMSHALLGHAVILHLSLINNGKLD